ncbi:histone deacetylase KNAG_0H00630 [Huiozyma naganishii CBS 8797]|uniref:histone deacetylase n=1 Tax=Huiozyma naganishii (strain ATCC MYA-139 / BCRC 22969 / CBS 8797 / KCTC 17520 / NBRC 10181 / NCYC 3082 / Yp74L-3) TaxID=1071383 RepID=J7S8E3_HUIN7|nr:hypothetical protein KNAG_0H00630 [Kazachstania naganishii CBS 8797]CCK71479.1 hypothetical protein KNAG_0H00630 [Kazachstania naganishii CBS 8797]
MSYVAIATSPFQSAVADLLPCNKYLKSRLTHALIEVYGLLDHVDECIVDAVAHRDQLVQFHQREYVDTVLNEQHNRVQLYDSDGETGWNYLNGVALEWGETGEGVDQCGFDSWKELFQYYLRVSDEITPSRKRPLDSDDDDGISGSEAKEEALKVFNLEGDCPIFSYLPMYVRTVTGATLQLADCLLRKAALDKRFIGMNWDGGRHHASKGKASGFCYVNDIVLLIQKLRKQGTGKVTYLDFDLHHGDGVERAFKFTKKVQTISLHLYEPGFFPCTGSLEGSSGFDTVNLPLQHGLTDSFLQGLVDQVVNPLIQRHGPEVIVIQCGGDGLLGDTFHEWQLSIRGLTKCILDVMSHSTQAHVILLGGGGYNPTLMSRFYTYLTGRILHQFKNTDPFPGMNGAQEESLIRDHKYIECYGDDEHYKFWVYSIQGSQKHRTLREENTTDQIDKFIKFYSI